MNFIWQCKKELVVALPILARMRNQILHLNGYKLNDGLCQALSSSLSKLKSDQLKQIILDSNGISDKNFSLVL
jgi:hypothetical protein